MKPYVDIATLPKMCSSKIWTCPAYPLPSGGHHLDKDHQHLGPQLPKRVETEKNSPVLRLVPFFVKLPHESPQKI